MIKIQNNNYPIVWQIDNSYNLPNVTGQVRWNGTTKCFEVSDNNMSGSWYKIDNTIQLTCDTQFESILNWAKKKMAEDERIEKLANEYPAVKDAKERLDIILKLVQNDSK